MCTTDGCRPGAGPWTPSTRSRSGGRSHRACATRATSGWSRRRRPTDTRRRSAAAPTPPGSAPAWRRNGPEGAPGFAPRAAWRSGSTDRCCGRWSACVLAGARRVYATSPYSRASVARAGGLDVGEVGILPLPVDLERFFPALDDDLGGDARRSGARLRRACERPAQERPPAARRAAAAPGRAGAPRRRAAGDAASPAGPGGRRGPVDRPVPAPGNHARRPVAPGGLRDRRGRGDGGRSARGDHAVRRAGGARPRLQGRRRAFRLLGRGARRTGASAAGRPGPAHVHASEGARVRRP